MGLGKTVQVVALLAALLRKRGTMQDKADLRARRRRSSAAASRADERGVKSDSGGGPAPFGGTAPPPGSAVVIVAPASVLQNWEGELSKWGHFSARKLDSKSTDEERAAACTDAASGRVEVLLVSHQMLEKVMGFIAGPVAGHHGVAEPGCSSSSSGGGGGGGGGYRYACLVVDEVHLFANPKTIMAKALRALVARCGCRVGLTGTPMSNKHAELFHLLSLLHPGCLGNFADFQDYYARPIKRAGAITAEADARRLGNRRQAELKRVIGPLMLRRTKEEFLADVLKQKFDRVVFCALSPLQRALYQRVLELPDFANVRHSGEPCPCGNGAVQGKCCFMVPYLQQAEAVARGGERWGAGAGAAEGGAVVGGRGIFEDTVVDPRAVVWRSLHPRDEPCPRCPHCVGFPCLSKLQKVANHPCLLLVDPSEANPSKRDTVEAFARVAFTPQMLADLRSGHTGGDDEPAASSASSSSSSSGENPYVRSTNFWDLSNAQHCGKLFVLEKLLTKFEAERHKCLVFSWSTQTLDVLEAFCKAHAWQHSRLDGGTPNGVRQKLVDDYNRSSSSFVFLCSTKAGGVGINLQSASRVVVFDVNWNPSYDAQAQDRAYRIGQEQAVHVYRLVCQGTIEERMYMRTIHKLRQTGEILDGKRSERMFDAIEGERKGELYGLPNLMKFDAAGFLDRLRKRSSSAAAPAAAAGDASDPGAAAAKESRSVAGGDGDSGGDGQDRGSGSESDNPDGKVLRSAAANSSAAGDVEGLNMVPQDEMGAMLAKSDDLDNILGRDPVEKRPGAEVSARHGHSSDDDGGDGKPGGDEADTLAIDGVQCVDGREFRRRHQDQEDSVIDADLLDEDDCDDARGEGGDAKPGRAEKKRSRKPLSVLGEKDNPEDNDGDFDDVTSVREEPLEGAGGENCEKRCRALPFGIKPQRGGAPTVAAPAPSQRRDEEGAGAPVAVGSSTIKAPATKAPAFSLYLPKYVNSKKKA